MILYCRTWGVCLDLLYSRNGPSCKLITNMWKGATWRGTVGCCLSTPCVNSVCENNCYNISTYWGTWNPVKWKSSLKVILKLKKYKSYSPKPWRKYCILNHWLFIFSLDCQGNASETETDPRLVQLFDEVDRLLKGSAEDKGAAYDLLLEHEYEACFPHNVYICIRIRWQVKENITWRGTSRFILSAYHHRHHHVTTTVIIIIIIIISCRLTIQK
jgi:hypothetical protein